MARLFGHHRRRSFMQAGSFVFDEALTDLSWAPRFDEQVIARLQP